MQSFSDSADAVKISKDAAERHPAQQQISGSYSMDPDSGSMATEWSVIVLTLTAVIQFTVVALSGSMALLGDTIHNFSDALSGLPLWLAFFLQRLRPDKRFSHGFGRFEDLAGIFIVGSIIMSGIIVSVESIFRLIYPQQVQHIPLVLAAAFVGFVGNEAVAIFRLKIGREIGSASLIADGQHARLDGFMSLSVIIGCLGVWMGFPQADSFVGLLMAALTLWAGWELAGTTLKRLVDEVDPLLLAEVSQTAMKQPGVKGIQSVKARYAGHRLRVELVVLVDGERSVENAQTTCKRLRNGLTASMPVIEHVAIELIAEN